MPRKTSRTARTACAPAWSFNEAAARCRGKPGGRGPTDPGVRASMRPRPDAAENLGSRIASVSVTCCFNEAAARCRGKPGRAPRLARQPRPASMRPRPDAAENAGGRVAADCRAAAASMRPRPDAAENPRSGPAAGPARPRFNEAAARCRGKRARVLFGPPPQGAASMRPRPDAAENAGRIKLW